MPVHHHMVGFSLRAPRRSSEPSIVSTHHCSSKTGILGSQRMGAGADRPFRISGRLDKECQGGPGFLPHLRDHVGSTPGGGGAAAELAKNALDNGGWGEGVAEGWRSSGRRCNELMMNYPDETAGESAKLQDEMDC